MNMILRIIPSVVTKKKVEDGIIVAPINQPELGRIVKMSPAIRDMVWNWIHNPKVFKNKEDWIEIREPIMEFMFTTVKIVLEYGPTENSNIFSSALHEFLKKTDQKRT